ncbi:lipoma-preferred partner homolog isoform X2 [Hemitrygon akajei]|uniref:lipoma-preferred partner homolog isoform X2 n=1 Tax=Hemitrygon akajei TaxID=2704970 RepID=UPI003BF9EE7F
MVSVPIKHSKTWASVPLSETGSSTSLLGDHREFPPPPPSVEGFSQIPAEFPPPPKLDPNESSISSDVQMGKKSLEERRSSLDAEIDSLTSILADLESSSPYQPRPRQSHGVSSPSGIQGPVSTAAHSPVIGHQRMVIPAQPLLTATKKAAGKPHTPPSMTPALAAKNPAQPVPASYTTASTSSQPAFNIQVKTAQPNPNFLPPGGHPTGPELAPAPPLPPPPPQQQYNPPPRSLEPGYRAAPARHPDPGYGYTPSPPHYQDTQPVAPGYRGEPAYGTQHPWRPEVAYSPSAPAHSTYRQPGPSKKPYTMEPAPAFQQPSKNVYQPLAPISAPAPVQNPVPAPAPAPNVPVARPEDELDRLTKKMLYDMDHPPSDDYFGQCVRCGESVIGDGAGCTAMDQVFHVDCFTCVTCGHKLRGQAFYAVEKKSYCEPCYISALEQCSVCSQPIMERILRATGRAFHPQCFTCVVCHRSLDGIPFTVDSSNQIHCIQDFHKKFAPRCSVCAEPIMPAEGQEETVRIVALDRDFHVQCYRCEDCGILLSDGDTQGCYPLDGHIYCKSCNARCIQLLSAKATTDL